MDERIDATAAHGHTSAMTMGSTWSGRFASTALVVLASVTACVEIARRPIDVAGVQESIAQRSLADSRLRDLCELRLATATEPWPPAAIDWPALVLAGWLFRPEIEVERARVAAAEAKAGNAGRLPNPTLGVTPGRVTYNGPASPWTTVIGVDFVIPTAGKPTKRVAVAEQETELARLDGAATLWRIYAEVRDASFAVRAAQRSNAAAIAALRQRQLELMERRREAGLADRAEVAAARAARDRSGFEEGRAAAELQLARDRLAAAIGIVPLGAGTRETPPTTELAPLAWPDGYPSAEVALAARGLSDRLDLRRALADYEAAERRLELELAMQYPDLQLGPGWEYDQGDRKYTLGFAIELPLFDRNQGGIADALATRTERAALFEQRQASADGEVASSLAAFIAARERLAEAHEEGEERAAERRKAAEARFAAGLSDQAEWVAAQIEDLEFREELAIAERDFFVAWSRYEDAIERPLEPRVAGWAGAFGPADEERRGER